MPLTAVLLCFSGVTLISRTEQTPKSTPVEPSSKLPGCGECHRVQTDGFTHSGHFLTSQLPSDRSVLGSFVAGHNLLKISDPAPVIGDPGVSYRMSKQDKTFYETAITGFSSPWSERSEPIDVVIGSGARGQSYLSWRGDRLYQLPVSYWAEGSQWINSPGYRNGPPNFDRPVTARCLECHTSYIKSLSNNPLDNAFERTTLATGITCDRCHGPGAAHGDFWRKKRRSSTADPVVNPARLSRNQQVAMCALCHSGERQSHLGNEFTYLPGQSLQGYLGPDTAANATPDVHGNQVGLLQRSKCYKGSPAMSCSTCHDVHTPRLAPAVYSSRCLQCHTLQSCGMHTRLTPERATQCIECHMPVQQSESIVSETADKLIRTTMRTHWIKVYATAGSSAPLATTD